MVTENEIVVGVSDHDLRDGRCCFLEVEYEHVHEVEF
jgi:hypothetical protein